jgi:ligand-binding sensor domain-containing protein
MCNTLSNFRVLYVHCRIFALVVIITLLSLTTGVRAQNPEWIVYNTENSELPANQVIELAFDPRGALWIGTRRGGLAKFDGETWNVYTQDNSGLPSNTVKALAFDDRGDLWVGTGDGLSLFDGQRWSVFTTENTDLPYHAIHALAVDPQGPLWIGTGRFYDLGGGGLAKLERKYFRWTVYTTDNSDLPGNQILALAIDAQGILWVGTEQGLAKFDGKTWTVYTSDNRALPGGPVPALACDAQGTIWIGTGGGGVIRFDGTAWTVYTAKNSELPSDTVNALAIDAQGILWVGTEQGLAKFDGKTWTVYTSDNSGLPDHWVWALTPDIQGNLWIGTLSRGVAVYREGGVLFPEQATKVEDLVGIWKSWYVGSLVYMQIEADGTCKRSPTLELLKDGISGSQGTFWFEGGDLKITEPSAEVLGYGPGTYEVWVRKRDGKVVHLSFHVIKDSASGRAQDLSKGMTRVEP